MARPIKRRLVCKMPRFNQYGPLSSGSDTEKYEGIVLSIEEFETIRLIDFEGLDQETSAARMDVARSTIQRIYNEARQKLADSLINGKVLKIEGGNYTVCPGDVHSKGCGHCHRHQHQHQ